MKQKTCKYCKQKFTPERPKAICCSPDCAYDYGLKVKSKAEAIQRQEDRKIVKLKLEKLKPLSYWADKAQVAVNAYIRARDAGQPCISCGRYHSGKVNAGHYRSRGGNGCTSLPPRQHSSPVRTMQHSQERKPT